MWMHLSKDNDKLIKRVRRLKGQLEGVERMLGEGADCYETLQRIAACRGAMNGLTRELIHEHIEHHLLEDSSATPSVRRASKDLQSIIDSYLK
jgi:DNA-binding FrmR family transcriptional regulator